MNVLLQIFSPLFLLGLGTLAAAVGLLLDKTLPFAIAATCGCVTLIRLWLDKE